MLLVFAGSRYLQCYHIFKNKQVLLISLKLYLKFSFASSFCNNYILNTFLITSQIILTIYVSLNLIHYWGLLIMASVPSDKSLNAKWNLHRQHCLLAKNNNAKILRSGDFLSVAGSSQYSHLW